MKYLIVLLFVCSFAVNLYAVDVSWGTITEHNHDQVLAIQEQNNMPDKEFYDYVLGKKPTPPGFELHSLTAEYPDHTIGKGKGIDLSLRISSSSSQNTIVVGAGFGAFYKAEFFITNTNADNLNYYLSSNNVVFGISMIAIKPEYTTPSLFKSFLDEFEKIARTRTKAVAVLIVFIKGDARCLYSRDKGFAHIQTLQNHFERPGGGYDDASVYMKRLKTLDE